MLSQILKCLKNNLSYQTADELKIAKKKIHGDKILIDLGQVQLTTSRGMASLISLVLDAYDRNQKVAICNVSEICMNIIDAMDLMTHVPNLKIFDTLPFYPFIYNLFLPSTIYNLFLTQ